MVRGSDCFLNHQGCQLRIHYPQAIADLFKQCRVLLFRTQLLARQSDLFVQFKRIESQPDHCRDHNGQAGGEEQPDLPGFSYHAVTSIPSVESRWQTCTPCHVP